MKLEASAMKRKLIKKLASVAAATLLFITGCGSEPGSASQSHVRMAADFSDAYSASDTWVVYWYLCGTDLESQNGAASDDLAELQRVSLPPNVKVVIQPGGANQWHTDGIPSRSAGRFLYDTGGLHSLGTFPDVNMGSGDGLADFLRFGKENFSADHSVFVFWDHGGGSVGGICLDERTQTMISLDEMRGAFNAVYGANTENPPFEVIGFDACLMATVDSLASVHGIIEMGRFLRKKGDKVDFLKLEGWFRKLGVNNMAQLHGSILISLFGFQLDELPFMDREKAMAETLGERDRRLTLAYLTHYPLSTTHSMLRRLHHAITQIEE